MNIGDKVSVPDVSNAHGVIKDRRRWTGRLHAFESFEGRQLVAVLVGAELWWYSPEQCKLLETQLRLQ
jgi:hypothetical protein